MNTIIGVFPNQEEAQQAVNELIAIGLDESQIGVVAKESSQKELVPAGSNSNDATEQAVQGAAAGAAVGLGAGTLWGLGIAAGILPLFGPVIAGGTIGVLLASAATGAAAGGVAGALTSLGVSNEHIHYYESEFTQGRVIVSVTTDRITEVQNILRKFGAYEYEHVH